MALGQPADTGAIDAWPGTLGGHLLGSGDVVRTNLDSNTIRRTVRNGAWERF